MKIATAPIGGRARKFLEKALDERAPTAPKTIREAARVIDPTEVRKGKGIGKRSVDDLLKVLLPVWDDLAKQKTMAGLPETKAPQKAEPDKPAKRRVRQRDLKVKPRSTPKTKPKMEVISQSGVTVIEEPLIDETPRPSAPPEAPEPPKDITPEPLPPQKKVIEIVSTFVSPAKDWETRRVMRASALNGLMQCGQRLKYIQFEQDKQREKGNEYTSVGQQGHDYMATMINTGGNEKIALQAFDRDTISDQTIEQMREAWRWIVEENHLPCYDTVDAPPGCQMLIEEAVSLDVAGVSIPGHVDYAYIDMEGREATLADWKFYHDAEALPNIVEDLQMLAYAVALRRFYDLDTVHVKRFLMYHKRLDQLTLDGQTISLGIEALTEAVEDIWRRRNVANIGHQCHACFQSDICTAYQRHVETTVSTTQLANFDVRQFDFQTDEQVRNFIIAAKTLEGVIQQGMKAAKLYTERIKRPIFDPVSRREWGPVASRRMVIKDASKAAAYVSQYIGKERAWKLLKINKGQIETALTAAKLKPDDRKKVFKNFLKMGIVDYANVESFEWRKVEVKKDTDMERIKQEVRDEISRLPADKADPRD